MTSVRSNFAMRLVISESSGILAVRGGFARTTCEVHAMFSSPTSARAPTPSTYACAAFRSTSSAAACPAAVRAGKPSLVAISRAMRASSSFSERVVYVPAAQVPPPGDGYGFITRQPVMRY